MTAFSAPALAASPTPRSRLSDAALLAACVVAAGATSLFLGQDSNWDLQNYHYYNPWAWWHGRNFTWDIAAAQLQTYHNALLDLPFYAMVAAGWPPRVIAVVLAIPTGVAAFFLAKLLPLLFADLVGYERRVAIVSAFAIGITSAMGVATLGTTMNEWPQVAMTLAALWLLVRAIVRSPTTPLGWTTLVGAGLLCGLASGAKLTAATFAVGLCVALLMRGPWNRDALIGLPSRSGRPFALTGLPSALRASGPFALGSGPSRSLRAFREALGFGLGVLAGAAVTLGPWAWQLWAHFDSPVFPYINQWIKSPWWGEYPVLMRRYGPHNLGEWLLFPFNLLSPRPFFVAEVPYRDVRFPFTWALALVAAAAWVAHRSSGKPMPIIDAGVSAAWRFVSAFVIVSFVLWTAQHSIYRYLVTLDMLTGALIVTLLQRLLRPGYLAGVATLAAIAIIATTRFADWSRIDFGPRWFDVSIPPIEDHALVLLTSGAPMAYVLPFFPANARHLGIHNNVSSPEQQTLMQATIARTVREHTGPIYSLSFPAGDGVETLEAYGLSIAPNSCRGVKTNMSVRPITLCRLVRRDAG